MFRPIKNLLTYIQKNASGASIFGGMTETAEVTEAVDTSTNTRTTKEATTQQKIDKEKAAAIAESAELIESVTKDKAKSLSKESEEMEEIQANLRERNVIKGSKSKMMASSSCGEIVVKESVELGAETDVKSLNGENLEDIEDIDDIESQIKSSVMLRKPLNHNNETQLNERKLNGGSGGRGGGAAAKAYDEEISKKYPLESENGEDFCSIASSDEGATAVIEEIEVLVTDDDFDENERVVPDDDAPYMDLPTEFGTFPNNELIILNEPDLNSSINSDAISEDPLAIDEFIEQDVAPVDEATNPLVSHNSTSSDVLWISIDDIKTSGNNSDMDKDICSDATPPITPTVTPNKITNRVCKAITSRALNKSLNDEDEELHPEELRSEGSDSGLGSETSTLQSTLSSVTDTSHSNATPTHKEDSFTSSAVDGQLEGGKSLHRKSPLTVTSSYKQPLRSNLKRRLVEVEDESPLDAQTTLNDVTSVHVSGGAQKKTKRSINFDNVQVFYFPRQQGFGCVPSAGGCTLGMGAQHVSFKTLTLAEHAAELRRAHRQQMQDVSPRGTIGASSSEDSEESEEDYLSEDSSDADGESSGFLQPVSPKQRRALLKAAGVRKIDASEKVECRDIRNSREVCGCTCRDFCDPETCACSQAGIKCQVDRAMFPCGCSRDACGNTVGRVEFNPSRVRTHFIHTIMRLEMESRHQQKSPAVATSHHSTTLGYVVPLPDSTTSSTALNQIGSNYYSMQQTQSNYSSGYASPAYPPLEQTAVPSYFHPQSHQTHYAEIVEPDAAIVEEASAYQVDNCLEASLFAGAGVSATPSYEELIPSYGDVCTAAGVAPSSQSASYHATTLNYSAVSNGESAVETVSSLSYTSYNHAASASMDYLNMNATTNINAMSNFSSCSVPSAPPFGAATTTAASATHYHESVLETTTTATLTASSINNSCSAIDGPTSFINLNSPISSSSRISAINNLLQHNRNTTAALVAVGQTTSNATEATVGSFATNTLGTTRAEQLLDSCSVNTNTIALSSLDTPTPPIVSMEGKSCINLDEESEATPLLPTPVAEVLNLDENHEMEELKSNKTSINVNKESNAPTCLTDVLTTSTTSMPEVAISALAGT